MPGLARLDVTPLRRLPAQALFAEEAQAIGAEAYVYFYPLVTMDLTRKQLTNSDPKTAGIAVR